MDHQAAAQQPAQYYPPQDAHWQQEKVDQLQQQTYEPYQLHPNDVVQPPRSTILSVTRGVALSVLAVIVFLLLIVIGLSAGLGVSQRDLHQVKGELEAAQAAFSSVATMYASNPTAERPVDVQS